MDQDVPYMPTVGKIPDILDKIQNAGSPDTFNLDFLNDLGFTSSNDRPFVKVLKYLGFIDGSNRPQSTYRDFLDSTRAKAILATRLRSAYDDLFLADKEAHTRTATQLKGWFKTKTGVSESVAEKMASTFKALADYADWAAPIVVPTPEPVIVIPSIPPTATPTPPPPPPADPPVIPRRPSIPADVGGLGLVYRLEVHLPDSQNIDTFRAIFKALREELL